MYFIETELTECQRCCTFQGREFRCAVTGACVDRSRLCDGVADCDDGSDELMPQCDIDGGNEIIGGNEPWNGGNGDSGSGGIVAAAVVGALFVGLCIAAAVLFRVNRNKSNNGGGGGRDQNRMAAAGLHQQHQVSQVWNILRIFYCHMIYFCWHYKVFCFFQQSFIG